MKAIDEKARKVFVQSYVDAGMDPVRARLITDLAVQAAQRAFESSENVLKLAPDVIAMAAANDIAMQIISTYAAAMHQHLQALACTYGIPRGDVKITWGIGEDG